MNNAIQIRDPQDLRPFLDLRIDPSRHIWMVGMRFRAIIGGQATWLNQANAVPCEILQPAMLAHSICSLVKWAVERPHLSNKPGYFVVQRGLTRSTETWFMDHRGALLDAEFPDWALFKDLLAKMRREGATFTVVVMDKEYLQ